MPRKLAVLVPGPRRRHPLPWAIGLVSLTSVIAGAAIGLAAGMTAGTFVIPIIGTAYGGAFGVWIGLMVSVVGTPVVVGVLVVRHREVTSPHAPLLDVARFASVLTVILVGIGVVVALFSFASNLLVGLWALAIVGAAASTLVVTLRVAIKAISVVWCLPFGWQRDTTRTMILGAGTSVQHPRLHRRERCIRAASPASRRA